MEEFFGQWYPFIDAITLDRILGTLNGCIDKVCPQPDKVFNAFTLCPYDKLKVVILGMDPYNSRERATGLAFANPIYTKPEDFSPSLRVLSETCERDYNDLPFYEAGVVFPSLIPLASQGVLLLNSALTTLEGKVGSHILLWRPFIAEFLKRLSAERKDIVYLLLGEVAQSFESCISVDPEFIIKEKHPSYYARVNQPMPDIYKAMDSVMLKHNIPLIFWQ